MLFFKKKKPKKDESSDLEQQAVDGSQVTESKHDLEDSKVDGIDKEANVGYSSLDAGDSKNTVVFESQSSEADLPEVSMSETSEDVVTNKDCKQVQAISDESDHSEAPIVEGRADLGFFGRLKLGLNKTGAGIGSAFLGKKALDDELLEDLETALLQADVGIAATEEILDALVAENSRKTLKDKEAIIAKLEESIEAILRPAEKNLTVDMMTSAGKPFVLLVVGVNGAGKTTSIGKIANRFKGSGLSVMLAAGDTFRAAASEQLKTWGEKVGIPVVAQTEGSDSASVIYDAYHSAKAKNIDLLIADTAGRLHTQVNLMDEIKKVVKVLKKADVSAPHEIMLVIDAGNGQNALNQAKVFHEALQLTGITITKLDGSAKGGILLAISQTLGVPIRFIGVGEQAGDLNDFSASAFAKALIQASQD